MASDTNLFATFTRLAPTPVLLKILYITFLVACCAAGPLFALE